MTNITARGWPGLVNYKPPTPIQTHHNNRDPATNHARNLRSFDLWLLLDLPLIQAYSGSVLMTSFLAIGDELRMWCRPDASVKTEPYGLWRAYQPNVAIVGYNLGYQLGQLAEYWQHTRDGRYRIWPYGWGKPRTTPKGQSYGSISPHRPPLLLRPRAKGWHVQFAPPKSGPPGAYGKWQNGRCFTGNFIDLESVEHALGT